MTREQKIEAFTMRVDGLSYEEIANKYGVSKQYIYQELCENTKKGNIKGVIYPNLADWLEREDISTQKFAEIIGAKANSSSNKSLISRRKLRGESLFNIREIKRILRYTGMTFEECFAEREDDNAKDNRTDGDSELD